MAFRQGRQAVRTGVAHHAPAAVLRVRLARHLPHHEVHPVYAHRRGPSGVQLQDASDREPVPRRLGRLLSA